MLSDREFTRQKNINLQLPYTSTKATALEYSTQRYFFDVYPICIPNCFCFPESSGRLVYGYKNKPNNNHERTLYLHNVYADSHKNLHVRLLFCYNKKKKTIHITLRFGSPKITKTEPYTNVRGTFCFCWDGNL